MTKVALPATLTRLDEALANLDLGDIKAAKRQIEIIRALVLSEMDVETRLRTKNAPRNWFRRLLWKVRMA